MSVSIAIARSPIKSVAPVAVVDGWEVSQRRSTAALRLSDQTPLAKVLVKADANGAFTAAHATSFGTARRVGDALEVGSDPGGWLTIGQVGRAAALIEAGTAVAAKAGEFVTVIDLTHGRALMRLTGAAAVTLLNKICAIDLSDVVTPNLSAFRSSVAKLVTDVVRDDLADGTRSYLLHCERSSGQHLFDCILDAGAEFDIDVEGWS
jgi:sarcosine oxidase, subunit gamma